MKHIVTGLTVVATLMMTSRDFAQTQPSTENTPQMQPLTTPSALTGVGQPPRFKTTVETSYTTEGEAKFRGGHFGDSDAFNVTAGAGTRLTLDEHWFMPVELGSQNLFLGSRSGLPLPNEIHTLRLGAGLGYKLNEQWTFTGVVTPSLYRLEDVDSSCLGASGALLAQWNYAPTLHLGFGLIVAPDSDLPVLPMAGVDWIINEQWELNLMFPKPRLIFTADEQWHFYSGLNMVSTTFRTSDSQGSFIGASQYNNALGTYRDIRLGVGADYQLCPAVGIEAELGCSVRRQIDYTRIDQTVDFDPAAYVQVALHCTF